ncbi:MAG TPA: S-methyl-5-thioribose-1-phosphate isomerase [Candidatus Aenigmarchaeota archaeon]|nr:S-methyl-5-thioribose-1-phosphate isomerase [Candidatus Aenigmarchaeota archaeon]
MIPAIAKIIKDIKDLKIQGSTNISTAGVECIRLAAKHSRAKTKRAFISELERLCVTLSKARVTEPALRNALKYVMIRIKLHEDFKTIKEYTEQVCRNYLRELRDMVKVIAEIGSGLIENGDVILTHCHSENVTAILLASKKQGKRFRVIVTETRPMYQGLITARALSKAGIKVTLCVDSAIGYVMKGVKKVLVGCDAILVDGSIVNKIGTFPIAVLARDFGVPFYVAGGTYKFATETVLGRQEPIENRDPKEVADPRSLPGVEIINPSFDVTPAEFIKILITEKGVTRPEWIMELSRGMFL